MSQKPQPVYSVKSEGDGFTVYRDTTPLQTPRSLSVTVPTQKLAEAIVQECVGQGEKLDLRKMPMTQMALTAIDISTNHREEVIAGIMRHGETELLCQRADTPPELVAAQSKTWQPYLDWCRAKFSADLTVGSGIVPFKQRPEALAALRVYVDACDAFHLTGASEAVGICGSLVLGLALATGHADVKAIFAAAECDALWQSQKWGEDPATENRQADIKRELDDCVRWFAFITTGA